MDVLDALVGVDADCVWYSLNSKCATFSGQALSADFATVEFKSEDKARAANVRRVLQHLEELTPSYLGR